MKRILLFSIIITNLFSQTFEKDTLALRAILNANNLDTLAITDQIMDTADGRVYIVYLWSLGLTVIPPDVGNLTAVKHLILSRNPLTGLPPEIGNLDSLMIFDCEYCEKLTTLPAEFGRLKKIIKLHFSHSGLCTLPPEFGGLISLKELSIDRSQLATFPKEIGNLKNLNQIFASGNKITHIPDEIGDVSSLEELFLGENELSSIPASIGKCSEIYDLELGNNNISQIPEEIGNLTKILILSIDSNKLTDIPPELINLVPSGRLDAGYNKLDPKLLPDSVVAWLDTYDSDWRATQDISTIIFSQSKIGNNVISIDQNICNSLIFYRLREALHLSLQLYSTSGKLVATLLDSYKSAGGYTVSIKNLSLGAGLYILKGMINKRIFVYNNVVVLN